MSTEAQHSETNVLLKPIAKARTEISSLGANENIFSSNLTPTREVGFFSVLVSMKQVGRLKVYWTDGSASDTIGVLSSVATFVVDEGYSFLLPVRQDRSYNFQYTAAGTVGLLQVDEVLG